MSTHSARFAAFAERTRESFGRQRWMASLGAQLTHDAPCEVLALDGQGPKTVALMQATMMAMKAG